MESCNSLFMQKVRVVLSAASLLFVALACEGLEGLDEPLQPEGSAGLLILNNLFYDNPEDNLTPQQRLIFTNILNFRGIVRARPVGMNVSLLTEEDTVHLNLFVDKIFLSVKNRIEVRAANDWTWFAKIPALQGDAIIVVQDPVVAGTIATREGVFSLHTLGGGVYAIAEIDQSRFPPD